MNEQEILNHEEERAIHFASRYTKQDVKLLESFLSVCKESGIETAEAMFKKMQAAVENKPLEPLDGTERFTLVWTKPNGEVYHIKALDEMVKILTQAVETTHRNSVQAKV